MTKYVLAGCFGSGDAEAYGLVEAKDVDGVAEARLKSFVERVERMDEEIRALQDDKKDIFAEAKGAGFDVKTMRKIVSMRKLDAEKRREADELLDLYKSAIGME